MFMSFSKTESVSLKLSGQKYINTKQCLYWACYKRTYLLKVNYNCYYNYHYDECTHSAEPSPQGLMCD